MIEGLLSNPTVVIIAVGALVGIASSLMGAFLLLRRASLLSDAISHSVLLGIILGYLVSGDQFSPWLMIGAAIAGVATVLFTGALESSGRVKSDAAIGLVFPLMFAVAVVLINVYARNVHIDADAVLLGEIGFSWLDKTDFLGLRVPQALLSLGAVTLLNALFVSLFYKELKLSTFDPGLAAALGFAPTLLYYALLTLTSMTAVAAFDAVGSILFVAFVIVPVSAAYLLTDKLWLMMLYGALISIASSFLGYALAVALDVSIGGSMAVTTGGFLGLALVFSPRYGLLAQEARRHRQRSENAQRLLVVHLYHHEGAPERENTSPEIEEHLRWRESKVVRVVSGALDRGLLERRGPELRLSERGRALAREVMEPWRRS